MSIYTRTGDTGTTSLLNGKRVHKSDLLIEASGSLDELSSFIGLASSKLKSGDSNSLLLTNIQKNLHQIMAFIIGNNNKIEYLVEEIKIFEQKIDENQSKLNKLNSFILQNGTEISCWFHVLRTICRRGERNVVRLAVSKKLNLNLIIKYLNRLSDLFFVLSRCYNGKKEIMI